MLTLHSNVILLLGHECIAVQHTVVTVVLIM
jgi:hypothetical protein